ncbi:methionine--tRNA ligase [Nanoarchaeota archaeon]
MVASHCLFSSKLEVGFSSRCFHWIKTAVYEVLKMKETRIITAALPFANNIPHLGNIAGSHLPADIFARFCKLKGYRTIFVGGTDEHGTAIEFAAQKLNKTPKELCDDLYIKHKSIYEWFGIGYDNFSRTSRPIHHKLVTEFFLSLHNAGVIIEDTINIPWCGRCQKGLADRYITGTCPSCDYEGANGDQCEKCAKIIEAKELLDPHCSVCKSNKVIFKDSKHLFLDLRNISREIENWIDSNSNLRSQVKALAKGWLRQGLLPRCITRDLKWGVKVPIKGYEDKIFYVWFDNVIGYISATLELLGNEGKQLWKDEKTKTYYFLGKDNIPFHTLFWPGQIIADGNYVLPHNVIGLQYVNFEGKKFSKSKQIGIFSDQAINSGIPLDYWRFYLTYILPETKDTDFVLADFKERVNKELIGNIGNFVNRTLKFAWNKYDGKVPAIKIRDAELEQKIIDKVKNIDSLYEKCEFRSALTEILKLSDIGNRYFSDKAPWKDDNSDVINYCTEISRILAILISPIVTEASQKILDLVNTSDTSLEISAVDKNITQPDILFQPLEDENLRCLH